MKLIISILFFISFALVGMEQPIKLYTRSDSERQSLILPPEICAKIATAKNMNFPILAKVERSVVWGRNFFEQQVFSKSWLKTYMSPKRLFENQLWIDKVNGDIIFRFDNDTTDDCNIFEIFNLGKYHIIGYDGPNNDGDTPGKIEGCHNGVILVGHTHTPPGEQKRSVFYLFKQHGVSAQQNKGVQKRIETLKGHGYALIYQGFPYVSEPLMGHEMVCAVIASNKRGALATVDQYKSNHLHVFEYAHESNACDAYKPDQFFTTHQIACADGLPCFKRLAWLYGKTLLGISQEHDLYVLAVDDKNSKITCHLQKTDRKLGQKFKDIALGRPYSQHELVLVDEKNRLYYANLKHQRLYGRGFVYKQIIDNVTDQEIKKIKTALQQPRISQNEIDRVWIYGDLVGLKQRSSRPVHLLYQGQDWAANFLSLTQACVSSKNVKKQIMELNKPTQEELMVKKEVIKATEKKRRRKK